MRDIRFRAWHIEKNQMFPVISLGISEIILGIPEQPDIRWGSVNLREVEIMQYTGLKDSKGKEIYEGDIIRYFDIGTGADGMIRSNLEHKRAVKWVESAFNLPFIQIALEVIGNIYETESALKP